MNYKLLLNFALTTGEIMLSNGAETFRVEDTISRILKTSGCQTAEAFVTPTGIFATLDHSDIDLMTYVRRIKVRTINLNRIEAANKISRDYCEGKLPLESAVYNLNQIKTEPPYPFILRLLSTGFAAGFFALVFGGSLDEFSIAFIAGLIFGLSEAGMRKLKLSKFFIDIIGGFIAAIVPYLFISGIGYLADYDVVVIGAIMPLVPGVAITNGIRDTLHGELISGVARIAEAFIIAISIAAGVGFALLILM